MRFIDRTVAGIDISQDRISIVVLQKGQKGPELVKSVVAPMPRGAVKDGNIENPSLLCRAIRELKLNNRIQTRRAAVSLYAKSVIMQIIDMPKQMPQNIRQFVQNEIKHCVVLPNSDISLDFCGLSSAKRAVDKRVLAVAAERGRMVELARICAQAGFSVEAIEPSLLSYLRAVNSQKVTGKRDSLVLVAVLRENILTLCVLKKGAVNFVRTKKVSQAASESDDLSEWLTEEFSQITKFYDIEVSGNTDKWEITLFVDSTQLQHVSEEYLQSKIQAVTLQVRTMDDASMDTPVCDSKIVKDASPSPIAIGLAMKPLAKQEDIVRINLLPPEVEKAREVKRDSLIAANVVAALLLIMILAVDGPVWRTDRMSRNVSEKKAVVSGQNIEDTLEQHRVLDAKIRAIARRLDRITQISVLQKNINWTDLFDDVRKATPGTVRITRLSCEDGTKMLIEGLAISNEAVYSFVDLLEKSQSIASVALLGTREQDGNRKLITYQISCMINIRSDEVDDFS